MPGSEGGASPGRDGAGRGESELRDGIARNAAVFTTSGLPQSVKCGENANAWALAEGVLGQGFRSHLVRVGGFGCDG